MKYSGLWAAKVPPLSRVVGGGSNECQEYLYFQYMVVTCPIYMVNETRGFVCSKGSTDEAVDHSQRQITVILV